MKSAVRFKKLLGLAGISLGLAAGSWAEASLAFSNTVPMPPEVNARAVVIMDEATGSILFAKNPDLVIPPASLTKLITLHVVYQELAAGRLTRDQLVTIDKHDCSPFIPYGSTLMYLRPDMKVSVIDLMRGAAVVSGNDAAFALARQVSGSKEAFAERMNEAVKALGIDDMHFVEPSGLSEKNQVTARAYANFCRLYMRLHPEAIGELHSLHFIEFPRPEHATEDFQPHGRMIQYNKNNLVLHYPGCDGLKTGYIIESGYNLAATAKRGDTRFIIVTLGGTGSGSRFGGTGQRSYDGGALLDWAFAHFVTEKPEIGEIPPIRVWFGRDSHLNVAGASDFAVTLPQSLSSSVKTRIELPATLEAPIEKGAKVGELIYSADDKVLRRVDLVASESIPKGNILVRLRDSFQKLFYDLRG